MLQKLSAKPKKNCQKFCQNFETAKLKMCYIQNMSIYLYFYNAKEFFDQMLLLLILSNEKQFHILTKFCLQNKQDATDGERKG